MKAKDKPDARDCGRLGEDYAVRFLENEGYRILHRNLHLSHYEIDVIAENHTSLVFAEVKTRTVPYLTDAGESPYAITPVMAVNREKRQNLISGARIYLERYPQSKTVRFDVFEVYVKRTGDAPEVLRIRHIKDAFWVS